MLKFRVAAKRHGVSLLLLMKVMTFIDYCGETAEIHAIISPFGACEVEVLLSAGAGTSMAGEIASRISEKAGCPVAPSVPVSYSESRFAPGGGAVTVRPNRRAPAPCREREMLSERLAEEPRLICRGILKYDGRPARAGQRGERRRIVSSTVNRVLEVLKR